MLRSFYHPSIMNIIKKKRGKQMVKHIVMWQVAAHEVHGTKEEVMVKMKEQLEGLKGEIEGLLNIEVGINFNDSPAAYDVVLYSEFVDAAALEYYQTHDKHIAVANDLIRQVATSRAVVDYTV